MPNKICIIFLSLFALSLNSKGQTADRANHQTGDRPNVLFITVDDMNTWGVLDNYPVLKVPGIRKLVAQSYYFENASCAAPVCIPSRAAFFSGIYPHKTGLYTNVQNGWEQSALLKQAETIPELFQRSGYETWGRGKTFHVKLPGTREDDMFDNDVYNGGFGPFADQDHQDKSNKHWYGIQEWEGPDTDFPDVRNTNAALEFLGKKHDKPFLMYLGIYRPHSPYTAPKRFYDLYNEKDMSVPPGYLKNDLNDVPGMGKALSKGMGAFQIKGLSEEEALARYLRAYCAGYSFADWNIGRIMDALDKSPYAKNTIVVFCSDNGFHNGTKDHWTKSTLWESADAVPFLIRLPDGKAYKCPQTVSTLDIYPTLIAYCGLASPKQKLDGQSIVPILKDPKYKWNRPGLTTADEGYSSVRSEHYRYIRYPDGTEELYDHRSDPYEHINLADKASMKKVIAELSESVPVDFAKALTEKPDNKKAGPKKGGPKKAAKNVRVGEDSK